MVFEKQYLFLIGVILIDRIHQGSLGDSLHHRTSVIFRERNISGDATHDHTVHPVTSVYDSETFEARRPRSIHRMYPRKKISSSNNRTQSHSPAYHQKMVTRTLFIVTVVFILSNMPHFFMEAIMFVLIRFCSVTNVPKVSIILISVQRTLQFSTYIFYKKKEE